MALWGNNDNVTSRGTVTVDYTTKIVVGNAGGSGTQFGAVGSASTGDVAVLPYPIMSNTLRGA